MTRPFASLLLLLVVLSVLGAAGCAPSFTPGTFIEAARVLAIRTTPPEASPGEAVHLEPLVVGPSGTLKPGVDFTGTWWRCPDGDSDALADFYECTTPKQRIILASGGANDAGYDDAAPIDLFGTPPAPGETPAPSPKLLGALLGYWRVTGFEMQAGARRVQSFKRTPIFAPIALSAVDPRLGDLDTRIDDQGRVVRNGNPKLTGVVVHEGEPGGPIVDAVKPGAVYFLEPQYDAAALESYLSLQVDLDGLDLTDTSSLTKLKSDELLRRFRRVTRCELPTFNWYATAGAFDRDSTVDERVTDDVFRPRGVTCPALEGEQRRPEVQFTAPAGKDEDSPEDAVPADGQIHAWVVMRDGRSGTDFLEFTLPLSTAP